MFDLSLSSCCFFNYFVCYKQKSMSQSKSKANGVIFSCVAIFQILMKKMINSELCHVAITQELIPQPYEHQWLLIVNGK